MYSTYRHSAPITYSNPIEKADLGPYPSMLLPIEHRHLTAFPNTRFGRTVMSLSENIQTPKEMTAATLLGVIAIASQGRYDVELPFGQLRPLSLAILNAGASGDRKSPLLDKLLSPLREVEKIEHKAHAHRLRQWEAEQLLWDTERKTLLRAIQQCRTRNQSTQDSGNALLDHEERRPPKPRRFALLHEDATSEGLLQSLAHDLPTAGLVTSEGHTILQSAVMRDLGKLNALLSRERVTSTRATKAPLIVEDSTLSLLLQVQPGILKRYLEKHGEPGREAGLWARCIISCPPTRQGTRFLDPNKVLDWSAYEEFCERLTQLTRENLILIHAPDLERNRMTFSDDAARRWCQFYNEIEREIQPGGRFEQSGDHAAKLAEMSARIAALIQRFDSDSLVIEVDSLLLAIDICLHSSENFHRIFHALPQEEQDAIHLDAWLEELRHQGCQEVRRSFILWRGPNKLRQAQRLKAALEVLEHNMRIEQYKLNKTWFVRLRPNLTPPLSLTSPN